MRLVSWVLLLAIGCALPPPSGTSISGTPPSGSPPSGQLAPPPPEVATWPELASVLQPVIERLRTEHAIPGIGISVLAVDPATGRRRAYTAGFGELRPGGPPLPPDAVFRVASVSKLYTATAVMALAGRGAIDLDAPVQRYLPEFAPQNPFATAITVRHLLGHRAGLVREGPVGNYFTADEPSLSATVLALNDTTLTHAPGTGFKYSNPGFGVLGALVERVTGKPFPAAIEELVLRPLDLRDSDFRPRADMLARCAVGRMSTYDGRAIPTPTFAFGYGPAVDLRCTTTDLATFASSWFVGSGPSLLPGATWESMWRPVADDSGGCGLGFFVHELAGQRCVGHDGAVYGSASAVRALPDCGIAAAVVCTRDFANAVAERICERALLAVLAARRSEQLPLEPQPAPLGADSARVLAGCYRVGDNWVQLLERDGELFYDPDMGVRTRLRVGGDGDLLSDDPLSLGGRRLRRTATGLHDGNEDYVRDDAKPEEPPTELLPLLGEYGEDHNILIVYEDRGRLAVLVEWLVRDLPDAVRADEYVFPPGMYGGDRLRFVRDGAGNVVAAEVGGARFRRRPASGGGYRIRPNRPIAELLAAARTASPPPADPGLLAPDLVDLAALDPTLRIDLRYATADNFVGTAVYPADARALLQRPAAAALLAVHRALRQRGYGLWVFDAYRPWSATKVFWDATPAAQREFVADPAIGSRHNRGCAVDLTLYDLATGEPVAMPSAFDEFTARSHPDYPGGTSVQRWHRELLRTAMLAGGFSQNPSEWWHFDHADWQRYPIGNQALR